MDIPHHRPSNEDILHCNLFVSRRRDGGGYEVRVFVLLQNGYIIEFDVEKLVDGLEDSFDCKVVFEFYCDFLVDQSLEE